jgi:hypothetical protein
MYANNKSLRINKKRLTKKKVKEEIENGNFNKELSDFFSDATSIINKEFPKVYDLSNGNFLYVFDEKDFSIGGKGDIYSAENFQKIIRFYSILISDRKKDITSPNRMWKYYSKLGNKLIHQIEELKIEISTHLNIKENQLDFTYKSLDFLSDSLKNLENEEIRKKYFDHLVAYIGEVQRKRVNGKWNIKKPNSGGEDIFIDVGNERCNLLPINIVECELRKIGEIDFRKATTNSLRIVLPYLKKNKN